MVRIEIECRSEEDMREKRDKVCEALAGNKAFVDSDIIVTDGDGKSFQVLLDGPVFAKVSLAVQAEVAWLNRYFYTFGTDPAFPYTEGWVEVHSTSWSEADAKFRQRFPDRPGHEGTLNCAFTYGEKRWAEINPEKNWPGWKCHEIIE